MIRGGVLTALAVIASGAEAAPLPIAEVTAPEIHCVFDTDCSITVDDSEIDLSAGFTNLHTEVYRSILDGKGYGIEEAQPAIELIHQIRTSTVATPNDSAHRMVKVQ